MGLKRCVRSSFRIQEKSTDPPAAAFGTNLSMTTSGNLCSSVAIGSTMKVPRIPVFYARGGNGSRNSKLICPV